MYGHASSACDGLVCTLCCFFLFFMFANDGTSMFLRESCFWHDSGVLRRWKCAAAADCVAACCVVGKICRTQQCAIG